MSNIKSRGGGADPDTLQPYDLTNTLNLIPLQPALMM